jgi:hypothetical protein
MSDADIDAALDALDEDAERTIRKEEPDGGSSGAPVPIPAPLSHEQPDVPAVLDDIDFACRTILRRTAAWRATAC